jgi:hypothetical protein
MGLLDKRKLLVYGGLNLDWDHSVRNPPGSSARSKVQA